jgi:hypothetical protein
VRFKMKKIISLMVIAILVAGAVFAQDKAPRENRQREVNTVSIEGTLKLDKNFVSVQSGDTVYRIPFLSKIISELKDGAKVSVEGYAFRNVIMPKSVTVDGKAIDLAAIGPRAARNIEPRTPNAERRMTPRIPSERMGPMHFNPGQRRAPNPPQG